jgi:peroxiredoxin Q/BCP
MLNEGSPFPSFSLQNQDGNLITNTIPNAKVIGVSPDGVKSHRKFADKFSLSFDLLADTDHALAEACGVWVEKSMYGKKYMGIERTTFVIDENGIVTKVFTKVKPAGHAEEVIAAL